MSLEPRPRGRSNDGRPHDLASTMLRVALAERTDAGRLMRGRRLVDDNAVGPLVIARGTIGASVQGGEPAPYDVEWTVQPLAASVEHRRRQFPLDHPQRSVRLVPGAHDLRASCTCIDSSTLIDDTVCKHAVAALLQFADQVADDPTKLALWRGVPFDADEPIDPDDPALDHRAAETPSSRSTLGRSNDRLSTTRSDDSPTGFVDPLGDLLAFPAAAHPLPSRFDITPLVSPTPSADDDLVVTVLADAIEWMRDAAPW